MRSVNTYPIRDPAHTSEPEWQTGQHRGEQQPHPEPPLTTPSRGHRVGLSPPQFDHPAKRVTEVRHGTVDDHYHHQAHRFDGVLAQRDNLGHQPLAPGDACHPDDEQHSVIDQPTKLPPPNDLATSQETFWELIYHREGWDTILK